MKHLISCTHCGWEGRVDELEKCTFNLLSDSCPGCGGTGITEYGPVLVPNPRPETSKEALQNVFEAVYDALLYSDASTESILQKVEDAFDRTRKRLERNSS